MVSIVRLLFVLVATSCGAPGVVVELYNGTQDGVVVRLAYNDSSTSTERLAPGARGEFGPAVSWHVLLASALVELRHPGDEFAESRPFGQQLFRFQAAAPGCLFVLLPEQRSPAAQLPSQPRGYPLGASDLCGRAPGAARGGE